MTTFVERWEKLLPPWLKRHWGGKLAGFIALAADAMAEGASVALVAPWLGVDASPNDALPLVGAESSLPRYSTESEPTYRTRLLNRWDAHEKGGTRPTPTTGAVCEQLQHFGLAGARMIRNYDWRLSGPPGDWDNFSRFWIVLDDHWWSQTFVGGGTVGDGTVGSTASPQEVRDVRAINRRHKAGHDICPGIFVIFSGSIIGDLGGTVGDGTIGGAAIEWKGWPI